MTDFLDKIQLNIRQKLIAQEQVEVKNLCCVPIFIGHRTTKLVNGKTKAWRKIKIPMSTARARLWKKT
jgi:hypothetical protein